KRTGTDALRDFRVLFLYRSLLLIVLTVLIGESVMLFLPLRALLRGERPGENFDDFILINILPKGQLPLRCAIIGFADWYGKLHQVWLTESIVDLILRHSQGHSLD